MKFSEFWATVLRLYEQDGFDFEALSDERQEEKKEDFRTLWYDGIDPQEAYDTLN